MILIPAIVGALLSRNEKGLGQLHLVVKETPVYPTFVQVKSSESSKLNAAFIDITYNVPAYSVSFEEVKAFYTRELTSRGWQPQPYMHKPLIDLGGDRDGHVTFSKGDCWITVIPGATISTYSVHYRWENPLF